jgi:1-hydroxycarotenoid 3,4-desaturase
VVIGGGVAGLVASIELSRRGVPVILLERSARVGGKMRQVDVAGRLVDAGPTVLTMRWVFEEIFAAAGASLEEHLTLRPVDVLARHAWENPGAGGSAGGSDVATLDLFADIERSADAIGAFAGAREARGYRDFCSYAQRIYQTVEEPFLRSERPSVGSILSAAGKLGLGALLNIDGHRNLWRALGEYFHDIRLRQLFARYATYCGSSPFLAPATLNVIAHVEREGVWIVEGGMYRVAEALAAIATRAGVTIRCGEHVAEILMASGRASGVRLASGERIPASAVVLNGDVAALAAGLFGAKPARGAQTGGDRSLSAMTWAIVAQTSGFPLVRHNVFFSQDYPAEFRDLFDRSSIPADPTVYICAQDRDDHGAIGAASAGGAVSDASAGGAVSGAASSSAAPEPPAEGAPAERMLFLINAPAFGDKKHLSPSEIQACQTRTWSRLRRSGLTLSEPMSPPVVTTPADFERLFPATGGALYGPASHGWSAPFVRASSRSRIPGLYVAGGSAHPGAGVPMAALSGRLAARSVTADLASTSRSSRAAMPGGMSMR